MSDLISMETALKHIEKKRQSALMIDDMRESSNIMLGMSLLEEAVMNQSSAQQKKLKYSGESICVHCQTKDCDGCLFEPMGGVMNE